MRAGKIVHKAGKKTYGVDENDSKIVITDTMCTRGAVSPSRKSTCSSYNLRVTSSGCNCAPGVDKAPEHCVSSCAHALHTSLANQNSQESIIGGARRLFRWACRACLDLQVLLDSVFARILTPSKTYREMQRWIRMRSSSGDVVFSSHPYALQRPCRCN